jgi:hypothetical protein
MRQRVRAFGHDEPVRVCEFCHNHLARTRHLPIIIIIIIIIII